MKIRKLMEKQSLLNDDIFSADFPYIMQLLLPFEAYDEITKNEDIYSLDIIDNILIYKINKKNKYNQNNNSFCLYGYQNYKKYLIIKLQNVQSNQWIKVNGDGKKI